MELPPIPTFSVPEAGLRYWDQNPISFVSLSNPGTHWAGSVGSDLTAAIVPVTSTAAIWSGTVSTKPESRNSMVQSVSTAPVKQRVGLLAAGSTACAFNKTPASAMVYCKLTSVEPSKVTGSGIQVEAGDTKS